MEQVVIIADHPRECQNKINEWLTTNAGKVEITRILQSSATIGASGGMSAILHLTIFYRVI